MKRRCLEPGCPVLLTLPAPRRCPEHEAVRARAHSRNYGSAWQKLRPVILARDGGVCWRCGGPGADEVDHVVPLVHGGTSEPGNLRAAHKSCNSSAGARLGRR